VFGGYGRTNSTKVAEQRRRSQKHTSSDTIFDDNRPTTTTQAAFLANSNNIKRLIQTLREHIPMAGIYVKQADADTLIVSTALTTAESEQLPVIVVATNTDLLAKMVARATPSTAMHTMPHNTLQHS